MNLELEADIVLDLFSREHPTWWKRADRISQLMLEIPPGDLSLYEFLETCFELAEQEGLKTFSGH